MRLLLPVVQTPAPPLPPVPPVEPSILSQNTIEGILIAVVVVAVSLAVLFLVRPLFLALARRVEAGAPGSALQGDVDLLREQLAELEPLRGRLHELEERVEFTERLLARRKDQDLLPRQGTD